LRPTFELLWKEGEEMLRWLFFDCFLCWAYLSTLVPLVTGQSNGLTARDLFYAVDSSASQSASEFKVPQDSLNAVPNQPPQPGETASPAFALVAAGGTRPLGARYALLQRQQDREFVGVDPDKTEFRSADQVRITLQPNQDAYVYIVQRGSSGNWSLLFPSPAIDNGRNLIPAFRSVGVPGTGNEAFTFDDQPGEERLVLIVSRNPIDAERLVALLRTPEELNGENVVASAAPAGRARTTDQVRREGSYRDLVFETVEEDRLGVSKGVARYAINPLSSADAQLLVDLDLKHTKRGEE
jgi:hypothetical protein